jgi:hypothetical protein
LGGVLLVEWHFVEQYLSFDAKSSANGRSTNGNFPFFYLVICSFLSFLSIPGRTIRPYTAVYCENTASYTVPYYCAQDYEKIRSVYGAVWSTFTVKIRIAVWIDLGNYFFVTNKHLSLLFIILIIVCCKRDNTFIS